jgi:hypothetical protein
VDAGDGETTELAFDDAKESPTERASKLDR